MHEIDRSMPTLLACKFALISIFLYVFIFRTLCVSLGRYTFNVLFVVCFSFFLLLLHPSLLLFFVSLCIHSFCDHHRYYYYYYYWFVATHYVCDEFFSHFVSFHFRNVCQYFVSWRRWRRRRRRHTCTHTPFIRRRYRKSALPICAPLHWVHSFNEHVCLRKNNSYSRLYFKTAYARVIRTYILSRGTFNDYIYPHTYGHA